MRNAYSQNFRLLNLPFLGLKPLPLPSFHKPAGVVTCWRKLKPGSLLPDRISNAKLEKSKNKNETYIPTSS